jgi:hypothetical protein
MLLTFDQMSDEAQIWVFIASRSLSPQEGVRLLILTDEWLTEWSGYYPLCETAASQLLLERQVLIWAVNAHPREQQGISGHLTGSDLDPWFSRRDRFAAALVPPVGIEGNMDFLVEGSVVALGPAVLELARQGFIRRDTLVFDSCTMADWRADRFLHPLSDIPSLVQQLHL